MNDQSGASTVLAFLLGGAIGAGAALLLSPRSGRENRSELNRALHRIRGRAEVGEKELELRMYRAMDDISDTILDILSDGEEFTEARKAEVLQAIQEAKEGLAANAQEPSA